MGKDPDNQVLRHLREMRGEMKEFRDETKKSFREVHKVLDQHTMHLQFLEGPVEKLREGTLTAIGFAANADRQVKKVEEQVAALTKRVEKLEKAK